MRVQRTRTKQLRAPLTTTLGHQKVRSAISTHVRSIINLIILRVHGLPSRALIDKQNALTFSCFLLLTILSSPVKAPDATNKILVVSTDVLSPFILLRVALSVMLTVEPSRSFRRPC